MIEAVVRSAARQELRRISVCLITAVVGWWLAAYLAGCLHFANDTIRLLRDNAVNISDDALVHPETTPEVKWLKMTKPTRDALMAIYADHMEECSKFQAENSRVTIGESAILWLMQEAKQ